MNNTKLKLKAQFTRFGIIIMMGSMLIVFTQCLGGKSSDRGPAGDPNPIEVEDPPPPPPPPEDVDLKDAPDVGVKDFERMFYTMSEVTGVSTDSGEGLTRYRDIYRQQLPTDTRLESYLNSHILVTAKIASDFCDSLISSNTLRSNIWPSNQVNFDLNNMFETEVMRKVFITKMLEQFWGVNVLEPEEYSEGFVYIEDLILEARAMIPTPNTINTAKLACSAALAAPQVTFQ